MPAVTQWLPHQRPCSEANWPPLNGPLFEDVHGMLGDRSDLSEITVVTLEETIHVDEARQRLLKLFRSVPNDLMICW